VQRSQQLAALFLLGAFLVGAALGITADRLLAHRGATADSTAPTYVDTFSKEMELTPAQRAAVDSILDERHRIFESLLAPVRPKMDSAREAARRQIAARLDAGQTAKFQKYLQRMRAQDSASRAKR
jgi:Spy/CpxP family protein refolding chaperone